MTPQEALHEISIKAHQYTDDIKMIISKDCYTEIVNALEKQIPKKPKLKITGTTGWNTEYRCPNCNGFVTKGYCWHCGQALDWSDTE